MNYLIDQVLSMVKRFLVGYDGFSCHVVITLCALHVYYVLDILSVGSNGSMIRAPALFVVIVVAEVKPIKSRCYDCQHYKVH